MPSALVEIKKFAKHFLGCGPEGEEEIKPPKPAPPTGKLRLFNNYIKLLAVLGLTGYFVFLLVNLIVQYVADQMDPPLVVSQKPGEKGAPFFPALAICNTAYNKTIKLAEVGYALTSKSDSELNCFPESGDDNCADGFPKDKLWFWAFNVRNEDPNSNRRRLQVAKALYAAHRELQADDDYQGIEINDGLPDTDGAFDTNCVAVDATKLKAYVKINKQPVRQQLRMLFAFEKAPVDPEVVKTVGLNGLDVYFFGQVSKVPGTSSVDRTANAQIFANLFNDPELSTPFAFQTAIDDQIVMGQDQMTYMTISESQTISNGETRLEYNPLAVTAPLNRGNFINPQSPEVNDTSVGLAYIALSFNSPLITVYENTPPSFAQFLGSIGGLKSILFDFWAIALLILVSINQAHSMRNPGGKVLEKGATGTKGNTQVAVAAEDA